MTGPSSNPRPHVRSAIRRQFQSSAICFASTIVILAIPRDADADALDVAWFLSRVGGWSHSPLRAMSLLIGLMVVNYVTNILVIGLPARSIGQRTTVLMARDLVWFTLVAQGVDRLSAVIGATLGFVFVTAGGAHGETALGLGLAIGIPLNFLLAGIAVGLLAHWLLGRWGVVGRSRRNIALAAAILTNPAWAMAIWLLPLGN